MYTPSKGWLKFKISVTSFFWPCLLYFLDVGSDVWLAVDYFWENKLIAFFATLGIVIVAMAVQYISSLINPSKKTKSVLGRTAYVLQFVPSLVPIAVYLENCLAQVDYVNITQAVSNALFSIIRFLIRNVGIITV